MNMNPQRNQKGFTLVELMVSLAVFSIVMTVSVGTLLVLVDMNAKAQALYSASTNLSFALDSLAREVRTGYHYYCSDSDDALTQSFPNNSSTGNDCDSSDLLTDRNFITFIREEDGEQMAYRHNMAEGTIEVKSGSAGWMPITADDVFVESFEVVVENSETLSGGNNGSQPTIDLRVRGYVNNGLDSNTDFFIQTRIVQRRIDIL